VVDFKDAKDICVGPHGYIEARHAVVFHKDVWVTIGKIWRRVIAYRNRF
jgi:hypothetical protein